jgi:hypothetical protein
MLRALLFTGVALAVGCATRPQWNTVSTQPADSVSMQPDVESHEEDADDVQDIASAGHVVLISRSVESEADEWTLRQPSGFDGEPASKPQAAILLPTWSADDATVATSDQVEVPASTNSVLLPHYIVEKEAPTGDTDMKTSNDLSTPRRKSPFMLLRLTDKKDPPIRQ